MPDIFFLLFFYLSSFCLELQPAELLTLHPEITLGWVLGTVYDAGDQTLVDQCKTRALPIIKALWPFLFFFFFSFFKEKYIARLSIETIESEPLGHIQPEVTLGP